MKPLVYVAGPYSSDPVANTRRAIGVGMSIYDTGLSGAVVPHTSLLADFLDPRPVEDWYRFDLIQLEHCDAVYRLLGESTGADREVEHARRLDIPVFYETSRNWLAGALTGWLEGWAVVPDPKAVAS